MSDSPVAGRLRDVTWGANRFVAVGMDGTILHSNDGNRWKPASEVPVSDHLSDIAWGGDRFVAVAGYTILHSRDGDRWERASGNDVWFLYGVTWGGDRFIAVGWNGTIVQSRDGERWEETGESGTADPLHDVAFGNGRFVAVDWNGTIRDQPVTQPARCWIVHVSSSSSVRAASSRSSLPIAVRASPSVNASWSTGGARALLATVRSGNVSRMRSFSVRHVQHHLAAVLADVEGGEEIEVLRRGRPVARIVPLASEPQP